MERLGHHQAEGWRGRMGAVALAVVIAIIAVAAIVAVERDVGARFDENRHCCQLETLTSLRVTLEETFGWSEYPSEVGQDKWVLEKVFPDVGDGYFVDVGSGHGTIGSNSLALERRGWRGVCIDPMPVHMEGRTCQMFRDAVYSHGGRTIEFRTAGGFGGIADTLAAWNTAAARAPSITLRTVTLADLLARAQAPPFIHFVSLDIEGAELEALRAFPFARHRVGAWVIEHNREEPKRSRIAALLATHGYVRTHSWRQDDFYVNAGS